MKHHFYMIIAAVFLGTVGVIVKLIGTDVHYMTINFFRIFIGFLVLLIVAPRVDKKAFKVRKADLKDYFIIGLLLTAALSTYATSLLYTDVQNAVLLHYTYPFIVLILAYLMLNEKINETKIVTLIIALVGLVIINPFSMESNSLGNILAFLSAIFYGFLIVGMRKVDIDHGIGDAMWFFFFGSLILLPFAVYFGFAGFSYLVVLLGLATGLGHFFYNLALHKIEAEKGAIIATIIAPLVSIVLAAILVNEALNPRVIIGGTVLIISGIYLQTHDGIAEERKLK